MLKKLLICLPVLCFADHLPTTPTKGMVWPRPQGQKFKDDFYVYSPLSFQSKFTNRTCDLLEKAVVRNLNLLQGTLNAAIGKTSVADNHNVFLDPNYKGQLKEIHVQLNSDCEDYPHLHMDESYKLSVSSVVVLSSDSVWGIIRGLETFVQLFYVSNDNSDLLINATQIFDFPHYVHRGLLLDTSRHYLSLQSLLMTLEAMAINKMNVLHWHIVDDESFPYQSDVFPELSEKGAFHPAMVYSRATIEAVVEYARLYGIRVIPEFNVPGHTRSWGASHPELLTECYDYDGERGSTNKSETLGPINPFKKVVFKVLVQLIAEVQSRFPDKYFHIGGDGVDLNCWASNPGIQLILKNNQNHFDGVQSLHGKFMNRVMHLLGNTSNPIVSEDIYEYTGNANIPDNALIQVFNSDDHKIASMLSDNIQVVYSRGWNLTSPRNNFETLYKTEPREDTRDFVENQGQLKNIIGGEAYLTTERVDDSNIHSRIWPKASAVAEVLWSVTTGGEVPADVAGRMEEHTCRMIRRGVPAEPALQPGYCLHF